METTAGLAKLIGLVVSLSLRWMTRRKNDLLWNFRLEDFVLVKMTLKNKICVRIVHFNLHLFARH
jgi:hypothetical protein